MEKRKPHHDLEAFKRVCGRVETLDITLTAERSAMAMKFRRADTARLIRGVERNMFVKSMTSYDDHRRWQDVYHVSLPDGRVIYLKFTEDVITEFVILSFKEK